MVEGHTLAQAQLAEALCHTHRTYVTVSDMYFSYSQSALCSAWLSLVTLTMISASTLVFHSASLLMSLDCSTYKVK